MERGNQHSESGLIKFFTEYIERESLFLKKDVLQSSYVPDTILHREEEINHLANILAPCLKGERPSNVFLYGKPGSGKTTSAKYVSAQIENMAAQHNIPLKIIYVNCKLKKIADTEYRLVAQLSRELGKTIPPTGLPTEEVYKTFFSAIEQSQKNIILILDEIDELVKRTGDEALYNLTRINEELKKSCISLCGISNDVVFIESLDPRVRSSLSEEEIIFKPYNALQLRDILKERARIVFREGSLEGGVLEKCAAYAAREHGDARRALELLRVSGELAERAALEKITISQVDEAENKIEKDRIFDIISAQPTQVQATLYSILMTRNKNNMLFTGEVYEYYKNLCRQLHLQPLTQRRISDIIAELDMFGIIHARVISKGRYGRTREISLAIPHTLLPQIIQVLKDKLNI